MKANLQTKNQPKLGEVTLSPAAKEYLLNQALAKIKSGRYEDLDPVVGDSACQLSSFAVINIARKLATGTDLSELEKRLLIDAEILCAGKTITYDVLLNATKDCIDERVIPTIPGLLDPNDYNKEAKIKFTKATLNSYVENRIAYLMEALAADERLSELFAILSNPVNRQRLQKNKSYELTCLPCSASLEAILMSELLSGNPILITVKRMSRTLLADNMQSLCVQGVETFMFKPTAARDRFRFHPNPDLDERVAPYLHIFGNSVVNTGVESMRGMPLHGVSALPYMNTPSFETYKDIFVAGNILDILHLSAVAHKQFPGMIDAQPSFEASGSFSNMFRTVKELIESGNCGIPDDTRLYTTNKADVVTTDEMTFAIDHIFTGTFVQAIASNANMRERVQGEEVISSYYL